VSLVRYELGFYIPEADILHSHRSENLKSYVLNLSSPCSRTGVLGLIQLLTEISTRNISLGGGKARSAHKAETAPPSISLMSRNCGIVYVT
jgi:hypothetical protein